MERPRRLILPDFAGRPAALPDDPASWRSISPPPFGDAPTLLLGIGPGAAWKLPFIRSCSPVYWLEEPSILASLREKGASLPPAGEYGGKWQKITPEDALRLFRQCGTWFYKSGLRLAPDFWGELLAKMEVEALKTEAGEAHTGEKPKIAWLPGNDSRLLHQELKTALRQDGFKKIIETMPSAPGEENFTDALAKNSPSMVISVNFRGFDSEGRLFHLCQALGIPVAFWLVDNPWHILSGIKYPWWKQANIFMTDASFVKPLMENGAKYVAPLPLAVSPHMWREAAAIPYKDRLPPLFIGRSAFPERESYFGGMKIPAGLMANAGEKLLAPGSRPDYHWWSEKIGENPWPGSNGRLAGLGADTMSALNRANWIKGALPCGLRIVGDSGWYKLLPGAKILPPVDYYGALPRLYGESKAILNATSLLLPGSLNQRHFDVWAAGGLLLSDYTPGLEIFPAPLTGAMALSTPADFGAKIKYFRDNPNAADDLAAQWRSVLKKGHSYLDRLVFIKDSICTGAN